MELQSLIVQLLVIIGFGLYAYSYIKGQSIKDTINEIKDLFTK